MARRDIRLQDQMVTVSFCRQPVVTTGGLDLLKWDNGGTTGVLLPIIIIMVHKHIAWPLLRIASISFIATGILGLVSGLFQNNVVSGSILRLSVRVNECYLFQDLTIERKNACFIAQRCLNRYKIDKFCTIERRMEDIFAQLNNYWRRPFGRH